MFIPSTQFKALQSRSLSAVSDTFNSKWLERRKGGGGGGHGGGHGSGEGSSGRGDGESGSSGSSEASSPSAARGASPAFSGSRAALAFNIPSGKAVAQAYSGGGGKPYTLSSSSGFPGRQAGGGERSAVYGTSRIGSGYPYGSSGSYINGRPFPFVFIPIFIGAEYYGSEEYMNNTQRPGGDLTEAIIQPENNTAGVTYRIVGDNSSVTAVYGALVANCSVSNTTWAITPFAPSLTTYPLPEQVVQWYRASSFALSLDSYNNSAALPANMPASNSTPALPLSADTPLPTGLNTTFLECLNATIGVSVPLVQPPTPHHLSAQEIGTIVFSSLLVAGVLFILLIRCCPLIPCPCRRSSKVVTPDTRPWIKV